MEGYLITQKRNTTYLQRELSYQKQLEEMKEQEIREQQLREQQIKEQQSREQEMKEPEQEQEQKMEEQQESLSGNPARALA